MLLTGGVVFGIPQRAKRSAVAPETIAVSTETDVPPSQPLELSAAIDFTPLQGELYMLTLAIESTLTANLVDPLINVTVPRDASIFRPCDHNGIERHLGDVKPKGHHWLWTHEQHLLRTNTSTDFYFHLERDRRRGAIPIQVEVIHTDLPNGVWSYEVAVLQQPLDEEVLVSDLAVVIEHFEWDEFNQEAFILELKARITNQTRRKKRVKAYQLLTGGRESSVVFPTTNARVEVERRRDAHQRLDGQHTIDPGEHIVGWLVYALPWSSDPGPTDFTLSVRDELNQDYMATLRGPVG
jgi:hypothetical protein